MTCCSAWSRLNPTWEGVQILWVGGEGGASKAPPKKSMMELAETPSCYIHIKIIRYKFRDHMQKFEPLSQKLTEISRFGNLVKSRFHVTLVYKMAITR